MMGRSASGGAKYIQQALVVSVLVLLLIFVSFCLAEKADAAEQTSGTVVIDALNVRAGAGTLNEAIGMVYMGDTVTILGSAKDYTGTVWYQISYNNGTGYVSSDYVVLNSKNEYVYDAAFESALTAQGFPESYKPYLRQLHADYPNWVFRAADTGLDWTAAVDAESKPGVTLVSGTSASSWKSTDPGAYDAATGTYIQYDTGNWVTASRKIIEHYMDPRNFLNSGGIFQFLSHSYDGQTQTAEGLQNVLAGTFMSGVFPEESHATYNDVLMEAGVLTDVNPYVLASMILVEQGSSGVGRSISGTVSGYEGYYNHFNVGAYQSGGMDAVTRGLWYASQTGSYERPWNSIYKSILGGASFYSENYVKNNKYTLYFKKFNVMNGQENVGIGQYMTNVQGAESEAAALRKGYLSVMDSPMTFIVPVYQNMPETACLKPQSSANNDNYLSSLTVAGYDLSPKFSPEVTSYRVEIPASVNVVNIQATARGSGASVSGTGYIPAADASNLVNVTVKAASGEQRIYTLEIVRIQEDPDGTIRAAVQAAKSSLSSSLSEAGQVTLTWSAPENVKVDYYEVYRSTAKNSGYGTIAYYTTADASEFSYVDSGNFEVGKTYYYKMRGVRSIDGKKVFTQWSNKAWRTIKELPAETPDIPENPETPNNAGGSGIPASSVAQGVMATTIDVKASLTASGKIRLDWTKSAGYKVDYYEVYRSTARDSGYGTDPYFTSSNGTSNYYINSKGLSDGVTYYYKLRGVRTVDGQLVYTNWSNVTWQTIGAENPSDGTVSQDPTGITRIGVEATEIEMSSSLTENGKIRLDWSKTPGYKVDYYEVFRSTSRSSGYGTKAYYTTSSGSKTYYVNTGGLKSGSTYYYKIRGVRIIDGEKVYTKWSNKSWRTIP